MKTLPDSRLAPDPQPDATGDLRARPTGALALWQVNLMRVGYLVMVVGLALTKWPLLLDHGSWGLAEGTKNCLLIAMSLLALLGLRYPARMLPVLLFEVTWKLLWLGVVAVPLWSDHALTGAFRSQTGKVLWVALIIAVIPWAHVLTTYVMTPAEPWRRSRKAGSDL